MRIAARYEEGQVEAGDRLAATFTSGGESRRNKQDWKKSENILICYIVLFIVNTVIVVVFIYHYIVILVY